jgi:hypothetical protein
MEGENTMLRTIAAGVSAVALGSALAFGTPANAQARHHGVSWVGTVDDTVEVQVHGDDVRTVTVSGKGAWHVTQNVYGRLPVDRPVRVFLHDYQGRGRVRVVQQPDSSNGFTAIVRVRDPEPGSGRYHFDLTWARPGGMMGDRDNDGDFDRDNR